MKVQIAKSNQDIIREILEVCVSDIREIKFREITKNTSAFNVDDNIFEDIIDETRRRGYNPFALMAW